ncbi:MAG: glucose 1-dehydrogenase [Chloroflexi bacterium]|nr:glucose 1-dehydrogenase [Chloroflexota bacterium]
MRLQGKIAAVTGGGLGIGRATALAFAAEGATVALGDLQVDAAERVAEEIRAQGGRALALLLDVGESAQARAFVERIVAEYGRLDILFANAGISGSRDSFLDFTEDAWHEVLRVDLHGVFYCGQAAARQMVEQGGGCIVNMASINGFRGYENQVGYNVAKAGVVQLTQCMAVELARHNIRVVAVAPAQIGTRLTQVHSEEIRRQRTERIPLGRYGEPDEIARAVVFLASDDASFITGHTLPVDGGHLAGGIWTPRS